MRASFAAFACTVLVAALSANCSGTPMPDTVAMDATDQTPPPDGPGPDVTTDQPTVPDVVDAGRPDVVDPCAFDRAYSYGFEGGLSSYTEVSVLSPPREYTHRRTDNASMMTLMCMPAVPSCGGSGITSQTVAAAFLHPDVVGAFRATVPIVYGLDDRMSDGQVLAVRRADMHVFYVGSPCPMGDPSCRAVPAGIATLAGILYAFDQQQLAQPECMALH